MGLFISINTASAQLGQSPIDEAITFVATHAAIERRQGQIPEGPSLDVTFLLPGEQDKPDFAGMRMGGYTQESDTLFFETSVPEHILKSDNAPRYVAMVMQDVVSHASEYFTENNIRFDRLRWQQVMRNLTEAKTSPSKIH